MVAVLPSRMEEVLLLVGGRGLRESEVAKTLGVTRQTVNRVLREARAKLTEMFLGLAEVLNADIVRLNVSKGFAVLRSRQTRTKIYVIYVPGRGLRAVFEGGIDCSGDNVGLCTELVEAASQWGLIKPTGNTARDVERVLEAMEA